MESKLLLDLALILFATKVFGLLTRKLHLPQVVGALLTGIILGPALFGVVAPNVIIETIAGLGVLLIMFEAGLVTNLERLKKSFKSLLVIAPCGVVLSLGFGFLLSFLFGNGVMESIFLGVILMSSSVGIAVEALNEMGKLNTKAGALILGTSVVEDVFTVIIFSVVLSMSEGGVSFAGLGFSLLLKVAFFVLVAACGFLAFKFFEYLCIHRGMSKRLSVFGLAFCLLTAFAAEKFGLPNIMGAYFAGLVLCNSKAEKYIEEKSDVLSFMFFSPVFFASVGLQMSFSEIDGSEILFAVLLVFAAIASKLVGCGVGARLCKNSRRTSFEVGAGMIARCEFPVVAAVIGMSSGLVTKELFSVIIIMVIVTALITPILLKIAFARAKQELN